MAATASGRCLCGAVSYEGRGPLREVLSCHCEECRHRHGHVSPSTAARKPDLVLVEQRGLRWIYSPHSEAGARRGFCGECGSGSDADALSYLRLSLKDSPLVPSQGGEASVVRLQSEARNSEIRRGTMSTIELNTYEVHLGSTVSVTDQSAGREQTFTIVAPNHAAAAEGRLSAAAPVARALLGHRVGDLVDVRTPKGIRPLLIGEIA